MAKPPKPADIRALLVDDQADVITIFSTVLQSLGITLETTQSGADAVSLVKYELDQGKPYDIIFLDVMMPDMNGIEAARQMRAFGFKKPILALSADTSMIARKTSQEAGIDHYFVKTSFNKKLAAAILLQYCNLDV